MKILKNEEIPLSAWKNLINSNIYATPFQTPEFYNLFNSVKGLTARALAVITSDKLLALAIITLQKEAGFKGTFSQRGIIYGGPLVDPEYPQVLNLLLKEIPSACGKRIIYIETRNFSDYGKHKDAFIKQKWKYSPYLNFHLVTIDKASMIHNISSSRMRQIKRAIKLGVTWREAKSIAEVEEFYNILSDLYKKKIKKPLLPEDFFKTFFKQNLGKYLLVFLEGKLIGGMMCPILNGRAIYEFYICGLDQEYKQQYPSVMATWAAMEYANQNQIPLFDFMGAGPSGKEYGVRDFKSRFGGELVEYGRFIKVLNPLLYQIGKIAIKFLSGSR